MRRLAQQPEPHQNLERWLLTYADMITLLTAFFLMMYSMSVMSKGKFTQVANSVRSGFSGVLNGGQSILNGGGAHSDKAGVRPDTLYQNYKEAMQNLRAYVEQHKLGGKVSVREDERGVIISLISDNMLFVRGRADLNNSNADVLKQVAKILKAVPNNIQIEGHTCDLPIHTATFPSNWELSSARAGTILRYFTETQKQPSKRFVAAGYADTKPLAPNSSEGNRAKNRRVDIVILKTERQKEAELARKTEIQRISDEQKASADHKPVTEPDNPETPIGSTPSAPDKNTIPEP